MLNTLLYNLIIIILITAPNVTPSQSVGAISKDLAFRNNTRNLKCSKEKGFGDELIFSIKSGYQFPNKETELSGLPGGVLFIGSIESSVNNSFYIGTGFDYWQGKLDNFKLSEIENVKREYSYTEFYLFLRNRLTYKSLKFFLGFGVGTNSLNVTSIYGTERSHTFTIIPNLGSEIQLSRGFGLSLEFNYKILNQSNTTNNVFSFRFGPAFILN